MPSSISFALTTPQFLDGSKDVTRRLRWHRLKVGDTLCAVEKAQGLRKGQKVRRLGLIRVISVRRELLRAVIDNPVYGAEEMTREGFPPGHDLHDPAAFVRFFCKANNASPNTPVTRIEFVRVPK